MRKKWITVALPLALLLGVTTAASAQYERLTRPTDSIAVTDVALGLMTSDPGFEAGTPNPAWTEASTNFGTPLCDEASCGLGGGTGPNFGSWWAWFGGIGALEEGSVSQMVTVADPGDVTLTFNLETPVCSGDPADFFEVLVDGTQVLEVLGDDAGCDVVGYNDISIDLSGAVGATFMLEFHSIVQGTDPNLVTNFFVDNAHINGAPLIITGTCPGDITIDMSGATAGALTALLRGSGVGSGTIPGGPCVGTESGLTGIGLLTTLPASGMGGFSIDVTVPASACGLPLEVLDTGSCTVSNVAMIP